MRFASSAGWSGPIDASGLFLMLTAVSLVLFAVRLRKTPWSAAWDWWAVVAAIGGVGALAWAFDHDEAGYVALAAFVGLVVLPLRFDAAAQRASSSGDDARARRLSAIARVFHPMGVVGRRRGAFDAYRRIVAGESLDDAALEALGAKSDPLLAEVHRLTALHFAGRWREIREALSIPSRRHAVLKLGFGVFWLRTVARTGAPSDVVDAVHEVERWDPTLVDPDRRALLIFEACSALGDVAGVRAMLAAISRRSPRGAAQAGLAWAQHVSGDDRAARSTVDAALAADPHPRARRSLEHVLESLDRPTTTLPPEARALLDRLHEESAAAEALAPLRGVRGGRTPWLTWAIVLACVATWIVLERQPGGSTDENNLIRFGALIIPVDGQWWRLLTSTFLHSGILHLLFNVLALVVFGRFVEAFYGKIRYAIVYLVAALAGGLLVVALSHPEAGHGETLVGASGAIMGLGGAAVAAIAVRKDLRTSKRGRDELKFFALVFGLQIVMDQMIPAISGAAHLGGLFGGALAGAILVPRRSLPTHPKG